MSFLDADRDRLLAKIRPGQEAPGAAVQVRLQDDDREEDLRRDHQHRRRVHEGEGFNAALVSIVFANSIFSSKLD